MNEKKILELLCEYFNSTGVIELMPEVWREGCGAIFLDETTAEKRFVDGSMEISMKFDIALRVVGYAAGDRLRAFETFSVFAGQIEKHPLAGNLKIYKIRGPKLFGIYSEGAEYRSTYEVKYVKNGE